MAVQFVGKGTAATTTGSGTATPGMPPGYQAGDLLMLVAETAFVDPGVPSGWAVAAVINTGSGPANAAGAVNLLAYFRFATGSDAVSMSFSPGTSDHIYCILLAYRNVNLTGPLAAGTVPNQAVPDAFITPVSYNPVADGTTPSTSLSWASITTLENNALIVGLAALGLDSAATNNASSLTNASLSGLTIRHDETVSDGVGGGLVIWDGLLATAGATGTTTATVPSCTHAKANFGLRLSPAPAFSAPGATSIGTTSATPQITVTF